MCRLRLGLKAPALAWLEGAWASQNHEPGQKPKIRLGLAWLWPGPGLLVDMHDFTDFHLKSIVIDFIYV